MLPTIEEELENIAIINEIASSGMKQVATKNVEGAARRIEMIPHVMASHTLIVLERIYLQEHHCTSNSPGIQVSVVNSYAAASDVVSVTALSREDFPTDGNPIRATRPSPLYFIVSL